MFDYTARCDADGKHLADPFSGHAWAVWFSASKAINHRARPVAATVLSGG
jgi:hypothetical protein